MTADDCRSDTVVPLRLRVTTEADPGILDRIVGHFQNLNITPRRVAAEFGIRGEIHLELDICGLTAQRLTHIAAKLGQCVPVLNAWRHGGGRTTRAFAILA